MLKILNAEFENFDLAEKTSLKLRKTVKGIRKIKILSSSQSKKASQDDTFYFCLLPTAVTTNNYYTQTINSHSNNTNEENQKKTAILSVVCPEENVSAVHSILASSGGIAISSQTYIPYTNNL